MTILANCFDRNLLLDDETRYFGFGRTALVGESDKARVLYREIDPNGVLTAPRGSICLRGDAGNAGVYLNTDGAVAWTLLGAGGGSGNVEALRLDFTFATASPAVVGAINAGDTVLTATVKIETGFTDVMATLELGTIATPGEFLATTDITASSADTYQNTEPFNYAAPETIQLGIVPGGSVAGAGFVIVLVRRA
jgi:hypothetical protein